MYSGSLSRMTRCERRTASTTAGQDDNNRQSGLCVLYTCWREQPRRFDV